VNQKNVLINSSSSRYILAEQFLAIQKDPSNKSPINNPINLFNQKLHESSLDKETIDKMRIKAAEDIFDPKKIEILALNMDKTAPLLHKQYKANIDKLTKIKNELNRFAETVNNNPTKNKKIPLLSARTKLAIEELNKTGDINKVTAILNGDYDLKKQSLRTEALGKFTTTFFKENASTNEKAFNKIVEKISDIKNENNTPRMKR
jgi:hypothetical protein